MQAGTKVLQLRQKHGFKQIVIAELLNVSQSTISNIEKNQLQLNQQQIQTLANFFKVSVTFFFEEESVNNTKEKGDDFLQNIQAILIDFKQTVDDFRAQLKNKDMIIEFQQDKLLNKMTLVDDLELKVKKNEETILKLLTDINALKAVYYS